MEDCKEIDMFAYTDNGHGAIEVTLFVDKPGRYKLIIPEKNLNRMKDMSSLGKLITMDKKMQLDKDR